MSNQQRTKDFKALQAEWYKKLKEDGFEDIEDNKGRLNKYDGSALRQNYHEVILYESKETYYRIAGQFLYSHQFQSERDRLVWELHATGVSIRKIVETLKAKKLPGAYRRVVHVTIQSLRKEMALSCL